MSTLTTAPEVARYLGEARRHLADLPAEERDGLLEDLEDHPAEVAAEHGLPLERRLGEPGTFAAELRASAGLDGGPQTGAAPRRGGEARSGPWPRLCRRRWLRSHLAAGGGLPAGAAARLVGVARLSGRGRPCRHR